MSRIYTEEFHLKLWDETFNIKYLPIAIMQKAEEIATDVSIEEPTLGKESIDAGRKSLRYLIYYGVIDSEGKRSFSWKEIDALPSVVFLELGNAVRLANSLSNTDIIKNVEEEFLKNQ